MLATLYTLAIFAYIYSFVLFIRFFIWRRLSWAKHWKSKVKVTLDQVKSIARSRGQSLPFFTVMVPARDESKVIGRTIENLTKIDYPKNHFQIMVVTDEKERIARTESKDEVITELSGILAGNPADQVSASARELLIAWIIDILPLGKLTHTVLSLDSKVKRDEFTYEFKQFLFQFMTTITEGKPTDISNILYFLRRSMVGKSDRDLSDPTVEIIMLSRLVARGVLLILGESEKYLTIKTQNISTQIKSFPKKDTMNRISELDSVVSSERTKNNDLKSLYTRYFLTTQQVVEQSIKRYGGEGFQITHAEVPFDFDGKFGGVCTGEPVRSTKGRALNYAFGLVNPQCEMVCFYDAESHPDHDVMIHLARWLLRDNTPDILQGPLFQVRNYYRMGVLSRIGGLYKAIAHDWYLPLMFTSLPFVGGTNLHISWDLLKKMKGFDDTSLTEDLEFGCRAYLNYGIKLDFLTVVSTEQTPPTMGQYFRQRLRWASGHLQIIRRIREYPREKDAAGDKRDFVNRANQLFRNLITVGPLEWIIYQLSTLVVLAMNLILIINLFGTGIPGPYFAENEILRWILIGLNVPYLAFTFYCYLRYDEVFDSTFRPAGRFSGIIDFAKLLIASFIVFLLPAPYTWSVVLAMIGKAPKTWVKTPRTSE